MRKALEDETLLAFAMNGADLPYHNGHPVRLVAGGWPASVSGKWVRKIEIRDRVHDGEKMKGMSYKVPKHPVAPGTKVPEEDMRIIESMPVKSIVTFPASGTTHPLAETFACRGHAWAGDLEVKEVHVSIDFGSTWVKADLKKPANRLAWQRWNAELKFPKKGYYEVWARAVDGEGKSQRCSCPDGIPKVTSTTPATASPCRRCDPDKPTMKTSCLAAILLFSPPSPARRNRRRRSPSIPPPG